MKKIFLAGATGSIGKNVFYCLDAINRYYLDKQQPENCFRITGVAIRRNYLSLHKSLQNSAKGGTDFSLPEVMASTDPDTVKKLSDLFPESKIFSSIQASAEEADYDIMVNALSGSVGIHATLAAITRGKKILLANKESLVMAGSLINALIQKNRTEMIPIDSEHSAVFQLMHNHPPHEINRIILTASGGPFFKNSKKNPTIADALNHPNWKMGKKISIDSATMMNKGLEVIEAHHLFAFPYEKIDIIIHPQSLVHSLVETVDGVQYAQLGSTDMRHPIFAALSHPKIIPHRLKPFNLFDHERLDFHKPDFKRFPMLKLAYDCGKMEVEKGSHHCAVMNAANEQAVELFLEEKISFSHIHPLVHAMVEKYDGKPIQENKKIQEIIDLDLETKIKTRETAVRNSKTKKAK